MNACPTAATDRVSARPRLVPEESPAPTLRLFSRTPLLRKPVLRRPAGSAIPAAPLSASGPSADDLLSAADRPSFPDGAVCRPRSMRGRILAAWTLLTTLAAGGGLQVGCVSDPTGATDRRHLVTRSVRIEASSPATRTELADNGYDMLWSPGDTIGVFVESGSTFTTANVPLVYEGSEPAAGGTFAGEITLDAGASSSTLYAYYPYSADAGTTASALSFTLASQQTQAASGDSSHLGDYDLLVAAPVTTATGDFGPLTFSHAFAVIEVDLTGAGSMAGKRVASVRLFATDAATISSSGTISGTANMTGPFTFDLTSSSPAAASYAGGAAQINYCGVSFAEPPLLGSETVTAYLTINPADYSQGNGEVYAVVSTTDGYTATCTRSGPLLAAGRMLVLSEELSTGTAAGPTVELSASGETANCYIVTVPSQRYSFDATVAGNGVIPDSLRQAVLRYEGRTLSAEITGGGYAKLLWQSQPWLIEPGSVSYADGQITFALTERPTSLGGNAVIGLYPDASSDEALWSWHIWVTDQTNEELQAAAETYTMYAAYESVYGTGSARMMDRNLGAIYKEDGPYARSFRASLFQWGRKDPFPWGDVVYDEQSNPYNYLSEWTAVQSTGSPGQYIGYTGNTWYATAHPDTFIATTQGSSYDWYWGGGQGTTAAFRNNALWGNPDGTTVGSETTKTLFDPYPPGWKVPHPYVFSAFTQTGNTASVSSGDAEVSGTFVQGWNFLYDGTSTTYYPGVGYRYDELGVFFFSPSGYYWTSSPAPSDSFGAWTFGLTSSSVYERYSDPRGFGLPVRCQQE